MDASDEHKESNIEAVNAVLKQVGAEDIKTLVVYNKADLIEDSADELSEMIMALLTVYM